MATYRLTFLTLPLAVATVALGACGGGSNEATAGTGDRRAEFREAALKYAKCMREHGIDMPDTKPGRGGGIQLMAGPGTANNDTRKMDEAQQACRKYMESVRPPELSAEQEQRFKEQALEFARCMREHGIDMPDPQFGGDGRVTQRMEGGIDSRSERFQDAQQACAKGMRGGGPMTVGPGPDGP